MQKTRNNLEKNGFLRILMKFTRRREFALLLIMVIGVIVVSSITSSFLSPINLKAMALGFSLTGIIAVGMTVVLISGGFDLSVGSVFAASGITTAVLFVKLGVSVWIGMFAGLAVGLIFGVINGVVIGKIGINPLITTLSTLIIARGYTMFISEGRIASLRGSDPNFLILGRGELFGFPFMLILYVIITIVFAILFKKSIWLRNVFYTGSNEKAAHLSGINTSKIKISVYILSSMLAALCGIVSISRFGVSVPTAGDGLEIQTIAAVVIGGASLKGGEGSVVGSMLGILLMSFISNMLVLLGTSVYLQSLVSGVILLLVVIADNYNKKRLEK